MTENEAIEAGEQDSAGEQAPSSSLVASAGEDTVTLTAREIPQLAGELATQLFQGWQLALQDQFRAELELRLEAELEHRQHEARLLREEVAERRAMWDGMWSIRHPRGASTDTARWEMEQTIRRQAEELAETERQMREVRERLRGLGFASDEARVTVDAPGPAAEPAPPEQ